MQDIILKPMSTSRLFPQRNSVSDKTGYPQKVDEDPIVLVDKYLKKQFLPASLISPELFRLKSIWPFELLPDVLIIEEKRIVIHEKSFPYFITTQTVPLDRIFVFQITKSLFFSSIYIKADYSSNVDHTIHWVKHEDAKRAKEIVDGLKLKQAESVKVPEANSDKYMQTLQVLGNIYS